MWKRFRPLIREWKGVLIIGPSVAGLLIALRFFGWLQLLEWAAWDGFFQVRPQGPMDPRIVIVGVTEKDIETIGQWPFSDETIAELLEKVKQQNPRAIGLDIYRNLQVEPGHERLIKVFKDTPKLIGIKTVNRDGSGFAIAPSTVLQELDRVAVNNVVLDADGKVRRGLLYLRTKDGEAIASLGLRMALLYLEKEGISPKHATVNPDYLQLGQGVFVRLRMNDGSYIRTYDEGYQIVMNYMPPGSFQIISITDVLENRIPSNLLRDRIVLIGSTALSLSDFFYTPYSSTLIDAPQRTFGVEIHANLASQIVSTALDNRPLIKVWAEPLEWLWILGWSCIGVTFAWMGRYIPRKSRSLAAGWSAISIIISGSVAIAGCYVAFLAGWWIPVVPAVLAVVVSGIAIAGYVAHLEREERQTVMNLFERHVTPKIAEAIWRDRHKILEQGQLQGQELTATVLFTDLKGFSTISEQMEPHALMSWLNQYMESMAQIVLEHDGIIDKFIGDAVMAAFGVPLPSTTPEEIARDATAAVSCALAMAAKLEQLNLQWRAEKLPLVSMRVGIATGTVIAGSLGSHQRQDYTILGDTVNIAARLESYDKTMHGGACRILISEETWRYNQNQVPSELIGSVVLKGREKPVNVYQVMVKPSW